MQVRRDRQKDGQENGLRVELEKQDGRPPQPAPSGTHLGFAVGCCGIASSGEMRGPSGPAPPTTAPSSSSRLLTRTVLPAVECPAHASPASLLWGGPGSLAGPWGPRSPRSPPGGTHVLLLEGDKEKKYSPWGRETGTPQAQGAAAHSKPTHRVWGRWERSWVSGLNSPSPCPPKYPTLVWSSPPLLPHSPPLHGLSAELSLPLHPVRLFYDPPQSPGGKHQRKGCVRGPGRQLGPHGPESPPSVAPAQASLLSSQQESWSHQHLPVALFPCSEPSYGTHLQGRAKSFPIALGA